MEEQILDIAKKLYHNHLTPEKATNLLLLLLSNKVQSEELKCGMRHNEPNCNCEFKHCQEQGW